MGRLIAVVLFIAVLVPGGLLARAWALASGRRAVAAAAVQFVEPTADGAQALRRQAQHARGIRRIGLLLGVAAVAATIALFAEASVFLWLPALVVGALGGIVLAELTAPRPRWRIAAPPRRPRRSEQISPWLVAAMRAVVLAELTTAVILWRLHGLVSVTGRVASLFPLVVWLLAEAALLRVLVRPVPSEGADVPVDEALRTWSAHLVTAATSVLGLLPLGALLLVAGIGLGGRRTQGVDLVPVALVAGSFSAFAAGVAVAALLLPWLRPVRSGTRALTG